jgi:hypothetical protein
MSYLLSQYIPATLTVKVTEALKLLESVDKISWPTVPPTGNLFELIR